MKIRKEFSRLGVLDRTADIFSINVDYPRTSWRGSSVVTYGCNRKGYYVESVSGGKFLFVRTVYYED